MLRKLRTSFRTYFSPTDRRRERQKSPGWRLWSLRRFSSTTSPTFHRGGWVGGGAERLILEHSDSPSGPASRRAVKRLPPLARLIPQKQPEPREANRHARL